MKLICTDVVCSHGEFEVVLGVLAFHVLEVERQSSVVHQHRQLLVGRAKVAHELPHRLEVRKVQLHTSSAHALLCSVHTSHGRICDAVKRRNNNYLGIFHILTVFWWCPNIKTQQYNFTNERLLIWVSPSRSTIWWHYNNNVTRQLAVR